MFYHTKEQKPEKSLQQEKVHRICHRKKRKEKARELQKCDEVLTTQTSRQLCKVTVTTGSYLTTTTSTNSEEEEEANEKVFQVHRFVPLTNKWSSCTLTDTWTINTPRGE